jgi:hypothetical protein
MTIELHKMKERLEAKLAELQTHIAHLSEEYGRSGCPVEPARGSSRLQVVTFLMVSDLCLPVFPYSS